MTRLKAKKRRRSQRAGDKKGKAMKKLNKKTAEAQENRELAEGLMRAKGLDVEDQEALFAIEAMLGGLLLMRTGAAQAESWGCLANGLQDDLDKHFNGIETVLKKCRDGILYVSPEEEKATA